MFGIGKGKGQRGILNARNGLMSALALGAVLVGKKLLNKKKQAGSEAGLREAYPQSSEWTPDTTTPAATTA